MTLPRASDWQPSTPDAGLISQANETSSDFDLRAWLDAAATGASQGGALNKARQTLFMELFADSAVA